MSPSFIAEWEGRGYRALQVRLVGLLGGCVPIMDVTSATGLVWVSKQPSTYWGNPSPRWELTPFPRIRLQAVRTNPLHPIVLEKQVLIIENLCNLEQLPDFFLFLALPLKIRSGSPIRAVGISNYASLAEAEFTCPCHSRPPFWHVNRR